MDAESNNLTGQTPAKKKRGANGVHTFDKAAYMREYMKTYRAEHRANFAEYERKRRARVKARNARLLAEQGEKRNG